MSLREQLFFISIGVGYIALVWGGIWLQHRRDSARFRRIQAAVNRQRDEDFMGWAESLQSPEEEDVRNYVSNLWAEEEDWGESDSSDPDYHG